MKKKLLLFVLPLLLPMIASAYTAKINGIYYNFSGDNAIVTYQKGSSDSWTTIKSDYSGAVVIPESVLYNGKTYNVARISDWAFYNCSGLTTITIPSSVTSIGNGAFRDCNNLQKVIVPDITAWYNISISNSLSNPLYYAHHIFSDEETEITNLVIPNDVSSIGSYVFSGCSSLVSITIGDDVTSIGSYAFDNCSALTHVTIPESVTSIDNYAFYGCSNLTSVTLESNAIVSASRTADTSMKSIFGDQVQTYIIGDEVTSIGNFAFINCSGLKSITMSKNVTSIGTWAFNGCSALNNVVVPDIAAWCGISFSTLTSNPFRYASHIFSDEETEITNLVIPDDVTSIGTWAFFNCRYLTSITIPESVTSIGQEAFCGCSGLTSISIPNGVTILRYGVFSDCNGLTSVTIPEGVASIGNYAFNGCNSLTSVTIPESVTSIGDNAFYNCSNLTSVTVPYNVTAIGGSAFGGCTNLTNVTLECNAVVSATRTSETSMKSIFGEQVQTYIVGEGVTGIGSYAFCNCSDLTSITIPESITSMGYNAFSGCSGLKKVIVSNIAAWCGISFDYSKSNPLSQAHHIFSDEETEIIDLVIPEGVTKIGANALFGCTSLISVTIPESVTSIGYQSFWNCNSMTSITIPNSVSTIDDSAFSGCIGLISATIGTNVTNIGKNAFYNCSNLTSVTIPYNVTAIGGSAFAGCAKLTSVTLDCNAIVSASRTTDTSMKSIFGDQVQIYIIGDAVTSIGDFAFSGCDNLTSVTISGRVTNIAKKAFDNCTSLIKVIVPDVAAWCGITFYDTKSNPLQYAHHLFCDEETELTDLVIPEGVTNIKFASFYNCTGLTSVTIPNSVTSIGKSAFYGCSSLESISISENVINIGDYAFNNCSTLTSVIIPEKVTSIGEKAFYNCNSITSIIIPYSVTSIGNSAFLENTNLVSVVLKSNTIVSTARTADTSLKSIFGEQVQTYIIAEGVTSIGSHAFYNCSNTSSITIPESVMSVGSNAFSGTTWYDNLSDGLVYVGKVAYKYKGTMPEGTQITIKEGTSEITTSAFYGCNGLTSVIIPESIASIGSSAFSGCTNLTSVTLESDIIVSASRTSNTSMKSIFGNQVRTYIIGNVVTGIGDYAFCDCNDLTSITIGSGVLSIGSNAFYRTTPKKVIWLTNTPPVGYSSLDGAVNYAANNQYNSLTDVIVYPYLSSMFEVDGVKYVIVSPSERTCDAIDCDYSKSTDHIYIGETITNRNVTLTVKQVGQYFCYNYPSIKKLTLNSKGDICASAFYGCTGLKEASINNQGSIGYQAFYGCSLLKKAILGQEITSIGSEAFRDCSLLESIVIPNAVTFIGNNTFENCSAMTSVKIGTGMKTIPAYVFSGCFSLPMVQIPKNVTTISDYVFNGCIGLNTVQFDDGEAKLNLGSNGCNPLFADCPLDSVYIGRNIIYPTNSENGYSPFYRNTTLRSVAITDEETEISTNEFYGCTNLKNVKIGNGVTTIGDYAFSGCSCLEGFAFGSSVETIGKEAFSDCIAMTSIVSKVKVPPTCGSQALDDINKWECVLTIPKGYITVYQEADQWKDFFFIEEKSNNLMGDVNGDEEVDVLDVVDIARYVVGNPASTFEEGVADLNKDGTVNLGDAVALVNIIVGDQSFIEARQAHSRFIASDMLSLTDKDYYLSLILENERNYTAFQFDLYIPKDVDVTEMVLNAERKHGHQLLYNKVEDGHYRVAVLSTFNNDFKCNEGELLNIVLNGMISNMVGIRDIHFFDAKEHDYPFDDIEAVITTGITSTFSSQGQEIYDLQGCKLEKMQHGINIINGKKVFIK